MAKKKNQAKTNQSHLVLVWREPLSINEISPDQRAIRGFVDVFAVVRLDTQVVDSAVNASNRLPCTRATALREDHDIVCRQGQAQADVCVGGGKSSASMRSFVNPARASAASRVDCAGKLDQENPMGQVAQQGCRTKSSASTASLHKCFDNSLKPMFVRLKMSVARNHGRPK